VCCPLRGVSVMVRIFIFGVLVGFILVCGCFRVEEGVDRRRCARGCEACARCLNWVAAKDCFGLKDWIFQSRTLDQVSWHIDSVI
jgi:hypothetical protein